MKTVDLYNNGYLLETYSKVQNVDGRGVAIGSDPVFVLVMEDKKLTIDQGLDFIIITEEMEQDEVEKIKDESKVKHLNIVYGNDTLFMETEVYKYTRLANNDSLSFIDYNNNTLVKLLFVNKRAKDNVHISFVSEK